MSAKGEGEMCCEGTEGYGGDGAEPFQYREVANDDAAAAHALHAQSHRDGHDGHETLRNDGHLRQCHANLGCASR